MSGTTLHVLDAPSDSGGSVQLTIDTALEAHRTEPLVDGKDAASVWLTRDEWDDVDGELDRLDGALQIEWPDGETFEGRFHEVVREDGGKRLRMASYELDAETWSTTPGQLVYENVQDASVIGDLIDGDGADLEDVTTLSLGTVEELNLVNVSIPNRSPAAGVRTVAEETQADVYYDGTTVNYVEQRGDDKTASVTLSPSNRNVLGDINIIEDGRQTSVTHVEGYGAGQGPDQLTYTATTAAWDGSGRRNTISVEDTDIVQQQRLERLVDNIVDELDAAPDALTVECETREFDLEVGDEVTVDLPDEGIVETEVRIAKRERITDRDGDRLRLTLKTQPYSDGGGALGDLDTLNRVSKGYGGVTVPYTWTSGWDHAGDNVPQMTHVRNWPDNIVDEIEVELHVDVREWRAPLDISEHTHPFDASHGHDTQPHDHGDIDVSHAHDTQLHDHGDINVTHDHTLDGGLEDHAHPIDLLVTSVVNAYKTGFGVEVDSPGDTSTPYDTTVTIDSESDVWVTASAESTGTPDPPANCWLRAYDGSTTSSSLLEEVRLRQVEGRAVSPGLAVAGLDRSSGSLTVELEIEDSAFTNLQANGLTLMVIEVPTHTHDVDISDDTVPLYADDPGEPALLGIAEEEVIVESTPSRSVVVEEEVIVESTPSRSVVVDSEIISETTEPDTGALAQIVTEFDGTTPPLPTDVEISIDGQTVTTLAGDADNPWDATVDLTGELTPGDSQITALPGNGRGEINLTFTAEVFRQGRTV